MATKKREFKANREWTKDFKFNGYWYRLSSVFDRSYERGKLDFDADIDRLDFDRDVDTSRFRRKRDKMLNEED